jgi:excisionase family DNA binding protein
MSQPKHTQLITVEEAARRLAVSIATIRKMLTRGQLPKVKVTKRAVRIPEAAVERVAHGRSSA